MPPLSPLRRDGAPVLPRSAWRTNRGRFHAWGGRSPMSRARSGRVAGGDAALIVVAGLGLAALGLVAILAPDVMWSWTDPRNEAMRQASERTPRWDTAEPHRRRDDDRRR